jgi:hypothetical protein
MGKETNKRKNREGQRGEDDGKRITLVAGPLSSAPPEGRRAPGRSTAQRKDDDRGRVEIQGGRGGSLGKHSI